jgi:hypothetical protein
MPKNPSETGRQCTVAKVRNWIGEGTFAGARSNDEDAPKPVIGAVRHRTAGSTQTRNFRVSRWLRKAILCGRYALGYRRGIGRNGIGFGPGRRARHMPARVLSSWTSPEIRVGFFQPVD